MQIKQDLFQLAQKMVQDMSPKYITVHNTANAQKDANQMHARYVKNPTTKESWDFNR